MAGQTDSRPSLLRRILIGRSVKRTAARAAVTTACLLLLWLVFRPVRVSGVSMEPSYHHGSIIVINRLAYWRRSPRRGDVVAIRFAGEKVLLLKRIIALPGERFGIKAGVVCINGQPLEEPYARLNREWEVKGAVLAGDEYWVIGDNREMHQEDHVYGVALRSRILGKALF